MARMAPGGLSRGRPTRSMSEIADAAIGTSIKRAYFERLVRSDLSGPVRKALDRHDPATARLFEAIAAFLAAVPAEIVATCEPLVELVLAAPGQTLAGPRPVGACELLGDAPAGAPGRPADGRAHRLAAGGPPRARARSRAPSTARAGGRVGGHVRARPAGPPAPPPATHADVAKRSSCGHRPGDSGRGTLRTASRLVTPGRALALTTTGGRTIDALDKLADRRVLVTGGSGSIGARLVERLLELETGVVRVFGRDETKQFYQRQRHPGRKDLRFLIGDIRDRDRLTGRWRASTSSSTARPSSTSNPGSTTRSRRPRRTSSAPRTSSTPASPPTSGR